MFELYIKAKRNRISFLCFILLVFVSNTLSASDSISHNLIYKIGLPIVPGVMWNSEDGMVHGFPLEIFEHIAADENLKFEWVEGSWPVLFNKILSGEIDALPATQISNERKKQLDFLENALYTMWSELYINSNDKFQSLSDLNGKKVGLVVGDNNGIGFEQYIKGFELKFTKVHLESHLKGVEMLKNNEIYAMAGPSHHMNSEWSKEVKQTGLYFNPTNLSISFPKGENKELREIIDGRLSIYKANPQSVYNKLYKKYNLSSFNQPDHELPYWIQILLPIFIITLIIGAIALFISRNQVKVKTQSLKQREIYLRRAMELGYMGTWVVDIKKWKINWSPEMFDVLGIEDSQEISFPYIRKLIHPEDLIYVSSLFFDSIKLGKNFEFECRIVKADGTMLYTKQIGLFYTDERGNLSKVIGIMQDITSQKSHAEQLIKAKEKAEESERLKSVFLANMSHEIRTPLNAIVGFSGLIGKSHLDDEKKTKFLKIIEKQNRLLLNLINDMIDFAKIESKSLMVNYSDQVDLGELISNVYETFQPHCPDKVEFKLIENNYWGSHLIRTDEIRLKQILNNLVINAFKYTNAGTVEIGYRSNNRKNRLEIFVKDTGLGIPEEHKLRIFDRFHQVNEMSQGTGLGLAICKSLANMLEGDIEFESLEKTGSEFTLVLPYSVIQESKESVYATSLVKEEVNINALDLSGVSILITEDNDPNLLYLDTILTEKNALTKHAKNGIEAIELVKTNEFDLVLMDIKMPKKNGLEATKEIKVIKPDLPIIAVTAYAFDADRSKALSAGCTDYISKPIDKEELFEIISLVLN